MPSLLHAATAVARDEPNLAAIKTLLDAGIPVPNRRLTGIEGHAVLLLDRFDRHRAGRVGSISAMTLLEGHDGESRDYTENAEAIPEHSSRPPLSHTVEATALASQPNA